MTASFASSIFADFLSFDWRDYAATAALILLSSVLAFSQISQHENTVIVEDAPDMEVIAFGKTVIIRKQAKLAVSLGGDVVVEGKVFGDVASIGGSVVQRDGAYIGGDVFAVGGEYKPESQDPLREPGRETVMFAGYEEEIRNLIQNPTSILSPSLSPAFFAQRLLSILFWFVISLGLTTIAPGAVSRSIARFHLSTVKIVALGAAAFVVTTIAVSCAAYVLPNYISLIFGAMMLVLFMLSYGFGRVALHVSVGKLLQKYAFGDRNRSEALTILIGVLVWTILLSIPYLWTLALFVLFSAGIGLVLTGRPQGNWQAR